MRSYFLVLFLVLAVSISGCQTTETSENGLSGTIRVSGAWALYPMVVKWAEEFNKIHPNTRIDISAGGAGKGAADALAGLVDLGMISREISPEEIAKGAAYVPVAKDAVFPVMSSKNPVKDILLEKGVKRQAFVDLWIEGMQLTWGDISGSQNNDEVSLYTRSDACGAADTWAMYLGARQENLKGTGVYGDPGLADAINNDLLGIGYNNLNYAYDFNTGIPVEGLLIIPIDVNENSMVDDNEKLDTKDMAVSAVSSGIYPSPPARDLYLMTKTEFSGMALEFVKWILTDGQQYLGETGYIQVSQSQLDNALEQIS
jgi:phosphate transport system substrate-binding protein